VNLHHAFHAQLTLHLAEHFELDRYLGSERRIAGSFWHLHSLHLSRRSLTPVKDVRTHETKKFVSFSPNLTQKQICEIFTK
jgi:hypothetical protein